LLLLESSQAVGLEEFTDLLCGDRQPVQVAACWMELVGQQAMFRLRQGEVNARPLTDLRAMRRDQHRQRLLEQRERRWLELLQRRQPLQAETLLPEQQERLGQGHRPWPAASSVGGAAAVGSPPFGVAGRHHLGHRFFR